MKRFYPFLFYVTIVFFARAEALACGYDCYPEIGFLGGSESNIFELPDRKNQFTENLVLILNIPIQAPPVYVDREPPWEKTIHAERVELRAALESIHAASIEEIVRLYCQMRTQKLSSYHAKRPIFNSKQCTVNFTKKIESNAMI